MSQVYAGTCVRVYGGSVKDCGCMLPNEGGFAECPPEARRVLPKYRSMGLGVKKINTRVSGFTGDVCDVCGSPQMVRNGSCLLCRSCGATSGCS